MEKLPFELTFASYKTLPVNSDRPSFRYNHWLGIRNIEHEGKAERWEISHVVRINLNRWSVRTFVYVTLQQCQDVYCIVVDGKDSIHRIDKIDMADLSLTMTARNADHLGIDRCPISLTGDDARFVYEPIHDNKDKLMLVDKHVTIGAVMIAADDWVKSTIETGWFNGLSRDTVSPDDDPSGQAGRNTQFSE